MSQVSAAFTLNRMWGNTLGWCIAILLLLLEGAAVWGISRMDRISPPTAFSAKSENLAELQLPAMPAISVEKKSADPSAMYHEAIRIVLEKRDAYEAFQQRGKFEEALGLAALDRLIEATGDAPAAIFSASPEKVISYSAEKPELEAIALAGRGAIRAALLMRKDDPHRARQYAEAAATLGRRLFDERLNGAEMMFGLELLSQGAALLERIAETSNDPAAARWKEYSEQVKQFSETRILPVNRVLLSIDSKVIASHSGDYFYFAKHAKERVWRVEAILALGRLQYYVGENGRAADQSGAKRTLRELAEDTDPVIRTAAIAARDLTLDQYRQLR